MSNRVFCLTKLQSAIFFELSEHKELTGYDLTKIIKNKGLYWSHQQVYRELQKMPLNMQEVPQVGSPDKKVYSLKSGVSFKHDVKNLDVRFLLAYPNRDLVVERLFSINDRLASLAKLPLSALNCFRIESANLERDYLLDLIEE